MVWLLTVKIIYRHLTATDQNVRLKEKPHTEHRILMWKVAAASACHVSVECKAVTFARELVCCSQGERPAVWRPPSMLFSKWWGAVFCDCSYTFCCLQPKRK